jgi:hypothetical protein
MLVAGCITLHHAAMGDGYKPRVLPLVWIAGGITLLVTATRLAGELQGWDARWFGTEAGSPLNPFGIVWLVPVFGFLFGRRAAQAGGRPPFVASFFVPMFAFLALVVAMILIGGRLEGDALRAALPWVAIGGPVLSLLALFAWPRMFVVMLLYAALARAPVMLVQYLDIQNGWQTHYGKVHPKLPAMTADERIGALTMAQATLWIPFTILLGCGFAALGAATARK